ncbi:MAG: hypothetical protein ACLR39_06000 [Oscillospiraceae bacterium]
MAYQKDGAFSMMGYGSVDLWMALSPTVRSPAPEELDNSAFTAEDIASLFGASSDIISTAAYGGVSTIPPDHLLYQYQRHGFRGHLSLCPPH